MAKIYLQFEDKVKEVWAPFYLVGTEDLSQQEDDSFLCEVLR